ncbi:MAG: TonB-dependent receptor [Acidobacteria bacterium]|nr:TonB-dependent receptor [Acidobacteriota bacterium]
MVHIRHMRAACAVAAACILTLASPVVPVLAQSTTATIQGVVRDDQGAVIPGATVTVRNVLTGQSRSAASQEEGQYRFPNLQVGEYALTVELTGFGTYTQSGLNLSLNQDAAIDVTLRPAGLAESVLVTADTPLLNTTNSEVGVRFDTRRVAELPVGNSRDIFSLALQASGVSQLGSGQTGFAAGTNFSVNGMRLRSNNFMLDGQDSNDPSVSGRAQPMNNTDLVQEVRLITNQFAAEYGRAAGSVMNVITKSGTNQFRGSTFLFHNDNSLNARSNLDKAAGRDKAPFFREQQYGATIGGPVLRNRTFFFGSYQKWTQDQLGSGSTLNGAPTDEGRRLLEAAAGTRPQVQALLRFLPPAQSPLGRTVPLTVNGQSLSIPIGSLTGSAQGVFTNHQGSGRVDQQFGGNNNLGGRYMINDSVQEGTGQVTPQGLTTTSPSRQHSFTGWWTRVFSTNLVNEARFGYQKLNTTTTASDPSSELIPSIEIPELGLTGFNAAASRTAIGLAVNLPQYRINDTFQYQNNLSYVRGRHAFKTGVDVRRINVESFFFPTIRGRLVYPTLQRLVDDNAETATINRPLPGGQSIQFYDWTDVFAYVQDEWRVADAFTVSLGLRYETPGNSIASLYPVNDAIVTEAGGDERYRLSTRPERDTDNWQPRVGFNWNPRTDGSGLTGLLTGGDKLVVRGGYARTNDYAFININLNIASAFPFVAAFNQPNLPNAFATLPGVQLSGLNPNTFARTIVSDDFRSPSADQFSLEFQRELTSDIVWRLGYVGTRGNDLFQTLDGNPRLPFSTQRVDPTLSTLRERSNTASSIYNSLQTSLQKRLRGGFAAEVHYTWSKFLDTASEIFNPSSGEVAVPQDSFNIAADRAVSTYDRPHRFNGNFVYELPFLRAQDSLIGKIFGGFQVSSGFTLQSGAPFTVLNGLDLSGALAGIDGLVGNAIRPNINTDLQLSKMTIPEIIAAGGSSLFRALCGNPSATCQGGERVGNVGRNTLRADGIGNIDVGIIKNTRFGARNLQFRLEMFNATNTRNFGIPEGRIISTNFLNQWGTDGGRRAIWASARFTY